MKPHEYREEVDWADGPGTDPAPRRYRYGVITDGRVQLWEGTLRLRSSGLQTVF